MKRSRFCRLAIVVLGSSLMFVGSSVVHAQPEPQVLLISGSAEVTGRDILGMEFALGSGPFSLQLTVPSPFSTALDTAGQQTWSSAFSEFWLNAPHSAFPRGGMTVANTLTAAREGDPDADFMSFGVFDCINGDCSIPVSSLPNSEALGFEGMFGSVLLPDGALGAGPFASLGDFVSHLAGLDLSTATDTFFNASYVPESLLGTSRASVMGGIDTDIRFVSVDGTITGIRIVPEPVSLFLGVLGALALAAGFVKPLLKR